MGAFIHEQFDKLALMLALVLFTVLAAHAAKFSDEPLVRFASTEADHIVGALLLVLSGRSAANRLNGNNGAPPPVPPAPPVPPTPAPGAAK